MKSSAFFIFPAAPVKKTEYPAHGLPVNMLKIRTAKKARLRVLFYIINGKTACEYSCYAKPFLFYCVSFGIQHGHRLFKVFLFHKDIIRVVC